MIKISLPSIFLLAVFLNALFSVLYFLSCILSQSALSSLHFLLSLLRRWYSTFFPAILVTLTQVSPTSRPHWNRSPTGCLQNVLTLNSSKNEFLIIVLKQQLSKIDNSSLITTYSARNLGFIFDENLTFSDQISSLSRSCYSHIRQLRCISPYLDSKTATTIAASIVHSKPDYCNSLYYNSTYHIKQSEAKQTVLPSLC